MRRIPTLVMACWMLLAGCAAFFPAAMAMETGPEDDLANAEAIAPGSTGGQVNVINATDHYRFNMTAEKQWRINCTNGYGDDIYCSILDSNGTAFASSPALKATETWTHRYIQGNTSDYYFIKVLRDINGTVSYTNYTVFLAIDDQNDGGLGGDAGDDIDHANNGTMFKPHQKGLVGDKDLYDYYFLQGAAGENFSITFGVSFGLSNPVLMLYNENKTSLDAINASSAFQGHLTFQLTYTGLFYLGVSPGSYYNGTCVEYYMNISSTAPPPADTTPPTVSITHPTGGSVLDHANVEVRGTASDNVAVEKVELNVNGGGWLTAIGTGGWTYDVTLSVGQNNIAARATDTSGNQGSTDVIVYVTHSGSANDTQPPWLNFTYPVTGSVLHDPALEVRGYSNDNVAVLRTELRLNNGPWVTAIGNPTWTYNFTLEYGRNVISARAVDTSGNTDELWIVVYLTNASGNDTQAPWIKISHPLNGAAFSGMWVYIEGNATDDVEVFAVALAVNAGPWITAVGTTWWYLNITAVPGVNNLVARATDTSGNTAFDNVTFYYGAPSNDTIPPTVYIYDPMNHSTLYTTQYTVKWNASDNVAVLKVDIMINTGPWSIATPADPQWTHGTYDATLVTGNNTITAKSTDSSGNTAIHWISVWVNATGPATNDTSPPWINISFPAGWARLYFPYTNVTGTAGDNVGVAKVELRLDSGAWSLDTGTTGWYAFISNISQGNHSIEARATDTSGLFASTSIWVYYAPDTVPPTVEVTSVRNNTEVSKGTMVLRGSISDNANISRIEVYVNGEKVNVTLHADGTWEATIRLKEGKNNITTVAYDQAGNMISKQMTVKYTKPQPQPGFEALALASAIATGLLFIERRKKRA